MSGPTYAAREESYSKPNPIDLEKHALMFGSKNAPGRIALKEISRQQRLTTDYLNQVPGAAEKYWGKFLAPQKTEKTQTAAQGGLMSLRGYATGGTAINAEQEAFIKQTAKLMADGKELTQAQKDRLNSIEEKTGRNVSPYTDVGTKTPSDASIAKAAEQIQSSYAKTNPSTPADAEPSPYSNIIPDVSQNLPPGMANTFIKAGVDPTKFGDKYGGMTNPLAQQTFDYLQEMKAPEEYAQASGLYNQTASGLQSLAGYTPQNVSAQNAAAQQASAQMAKAAQMAQIADINAERGTAAQMGPIADVGAERTTAERIAGAQMQRPEDVQAQQLQRYLMGATAPVTTQDLQAYQMAGPGSWTDEGVQQKYMSPYIQGVIDISKREAERDYQKQVNALNAKAVGSKAFGGSRQALERAEAQRNYNEQLQDIQTRGLQQAYESGQSQYGQELGLSQQAALQNLQSKISTQSQSSQEALQAMLSNQNIDYQTKVQNLQSMLGVQNQEAQQMLNASLANQQTGLTTGQQSLSAEMQKQLANQQYGMTSQQANQQAALQAALANQQTAYGTGQFNAGNQQTMQLANIQNALQAALANQQTQFGVGSLNANLANQVGLQNAQLGTQASLTNAQLGTQTNLANAQNALQAGMANQTAGLQGNLQNINALGKVGDMAQGLGTIGNNNAAYNQQRLTNLAQGAETQMNNQQQWYDSAQKTAEKTYNAPAQGGITAGQVVGPMTGTPGGSTTNRS